MKTVYNFIPAPSKEEVVLPEWAKLVSHDEPFSDGESGEIQFELLALNPIASCQVQQPDDNPLRVFNHLFINNEIKYFLQATSIKGMVRSVIEIITYSYLNPNLVDNSRSSTREFFGHHAEGYLKSFNESIKDKRLKAGWLRKNDNNEWEIRPASSYYLIPHQNINQQFRNTFLNRRLNENQKKTFYKYGLLQNDFNTVGFTQNLSGKFSIDNEETKKYKNSPRTDSNDLNVLKRDQQGSISGKIVLTGQSSQRKEIEKEKPQGKIYEYVFVDNPNEVYTPIAVTPRQKKDFEFIHQTNNNQENDWDKWLKHFLNNGKEVPIFFTLNANNELLHFGLTKMYKLPNKNSIHDLQPISSYDFDNELERELDFSETLFGHTNKLNPLKGRIFFKHAFASSVVNNNQSINAVLASPRASFYPYYLENKHTYNNKSATLKGFKRYMLNNNTNKPINNNTNDNENIVTQFQILDPGTTFKCSITFHNLKKIEIGALISAITFHSGDRETDIVHRLGLGKSLGYGKLKVQQFEIKNVNHSANEYLIAFEEYMNNQLSNKNLPYTWNKSPRVNSLLAVQNQGEGIIVNNDIYEFGYPALEEFRKIKQNNDFKWHNIETLYYQITNKYFIDKPLIKVVPKGEQVLIDFVSLGLSKQDSVGKNLDRVLKYLLNHGFDKNELTDVNKILLADELIRLISQASKKDGILKKVGDNFKPPNGLAYVMLGEQQTQRIIKECGDKLNL